MRSKRAQFLQKLIFTLLCAMMLIFAIVILYNFVSTMEIKAQYKMTHMHYNSLAARVMYSPDCLATQKQYTSKLDTKYMVLAGKLDSKKLSTDRLNQCITGAEYGVIITKLDLNDMSEEKVFEHVVSSSISKACDKGDGWSRIGQFYVLVDDTPAVLTFCFKNMRVAGEIE